MEGPFMVIDMCNEKRVFRCIRTDIGVDSVAPGGQLGLKHARMCVSKSEGNGSFFRSQVKEMSEKFSFKMGIDLLLRPIIEDCLDVLHKVMYISAGT